MASVVKSETVERAVQSLLKWRATKAKKEKPQLLEHDEFVYLTLSLQKIPAKARTNPFKIPIPHALIDSEVSETCLIVDDRPTSDLTKAAAQEKVKAEGIPVAKVMKLSKLRTDFKAFEAKRKLCDSYDMFLADKRVLPVLPKVLGKYFFKKKKIPVGIDLTHKNWKEQIERVYGSALLFLSTGTCSVVKVARVSMGEKDIMENVVAAINGIAEVVPRKWGNVRSFHVKMLESLALPVYRTVPDFKLKIEGAREKDEKESKVKIKVSDEVSAVKKKGPKKGRIHEVKYMDTDLDEMADEDDASDAIDEASEDYEMVAVGKKRKKGDTENKEAVAELNGDKKVKKSGKLKKSDSAKKKEKKESLTAKGGEDLNSEKEEKKTKKKKEKKESLTSKGGEELNSEEEKKKTKKKKDSLTSKGGEELNSEEEKKKTKKKKEKKESLTAKGGNELNSEKEEKKKTKKKKL